MYDVEVTVDMLVDAKSEEEARRWAENWSTYEFFIGESVCEDEQLIEYNPEITGVKEAETLKV